MSFCPQITNLPAPLLARPPSEVSLPRVPGTSRRSKQKTPAGGHRSRSRGVSLPPAVPGTRSRAPVRRQSSAGARDGRRAAAEGRKSRNQREDGGRSEEERDRKRAGDGGGSDSAYGSDAASPPVDNFRLTESEYFKPKKVRHSTANDNEPNVFSGVFWLHIQ